MKAEVQPYKQWFIVVRHTEKGPQYWHSAESVRVPEGWDSEISRADRFSIQRNAEGRAKMLNSQTPSKA